MATNRSRKQVRESRALGLALTPKAVRYFEKRPYGPGEHGRARRRKESDYAVRLKEKQRLRAQYGIREAQLRRVFEEARRAEGLTGENLVELLEMRLDALVLRAGFARTIAAGPPGRRPPSHPRRRQDRRPSLLPRQARPDHPGQAAARRHRCPSRSPLPGRPPRRAARPFPSTSTSSSRSFGAPWCAAPSVTRSP